jgi:hypothetical protein
MFRFVAMALLMAVCTGVLADDITVHRRRPSRILAVLSGKTTNEMVKEAQGGQGILPDGVKVKADDRNGVLRATGDKEALEELKRYVALFDVEPKTIHVKVTVSCLAEKYEAVTEADVWNNQTWFTKDGATDLGLTVGCRINDNGTIMLSAALPTGLLTKTIVAFMKDGERALVLYRRGSTVAYNILDPKTGLNAANWTILGTKGDIVGQKLAFDPEAVYAQIKIKIQNSKGPSDGVTTKTP